MTTADARDFIAETGIAEQSHCYAFRLDNKKQESIGCYPLKRNGSVHIPIGGMKNASYGVFPASFLVHWTKKTGESEKAATNLLQALIKVRDMEINGFRIKFLQMLTADAQYVGTDETGVHEWVIEALIFYERKGQENG